jgi:hypothetical protein
MKLNYLPQRDKPEVEEEVAEDTPVEETEDDETEEIPAPVPGEGNNVAPKPVSKKGDDPPQKP